MISSKVGGTAKKYSRVDREGHGERIGQHKKEFTWTATQRNGLVSDW